MPPHLHHGLLGASLAGGLSNAATYHDRTVFTQIVPSGALRAALQVEAGRVRWTREQLAPGTVAIERDILLQERRERIESRPYGRSLEVLQALLFPAGHPYSRPAAGLPGDLSGLDCDDVAAFVERYFTPDRAVLAIVGDVSADEAAHEAASYLGANGAAARTVASAHPAPAAPADRHARADGLDARAAYRVVEEDVPAARVFVALRTAGYGQREWYAASLLIRSLVLGRASPIKRRLVHEGGLATDVQALVVTCRDAGLLAVSATAAPGVEQARLEAHLLRTVHRGLTEPVREADLTRARRKALTDLYADLQYLDVRADRLATCAALLDEADGLRRDEQAWLTLTADDLLDAGRALLQPGRLAMLTIVARGNR